MIEISDWTSDSPIEPGWYGYWPSDDDSLFLFEDGWTIVNVYDRSVSGKCYLWVNIPFDVKHGRPTGLWETVRVVDVGGKWCGPIVLSEVMMESNKLNFWVAGCPAPGGSKTGFPIKRKDGTMGIAMAPASNKTKPWMALVSGVADHAVSEYAGHWDTSGPFHLHITYSFLRPKAHYGTGKNHRILKKSSPIQHTQRPDRGKLDRALEDALTGIIYADDSQVYSIRSFKVWVCRFLGRQGADVEAIRERFWDGSYES